VTDPGSQSARLGPLPHGLRQLADAAGIEAALAIALARRGTRLRVPCRAEGSILEGIVGIDAARAIVNDLAEVEIQVPLAKKVLARWLRFEQGWPVPKIAHRLGIAPRTLQYWFSDSTPRLQHDLFDTGA
jgi:hypothetical protein